jgi:hypothetical protein
LTNIEGIFKAIQRLSDSNLKGRLSKVPGSSSLPRKARSAAEEAQMREWIRGEELLTPPWNITKDSLFQFVEQGMLVPYDPHKGPIFPSEYLADQYESWLGLAMTFDALERNLAMSDEDSAIPGRLTGVVWQ